eukprot:scaffold29556_cov61-Attheya_sp.AAC.5
MDNNGTHPPVPPLTTGVAVCLSTPGRAPNTVCPSAPALPQYRMLHGYIDANLLKQAYTLGAMNDSYYFRFFQIVENGTNNA